MRLHSLSITGVGPFLRTQVVDFDELSGSGLFLIDGPTGSGKTTIIDAIVYALFGDVSGGGDSDAARIRSSYCTDADPTGVTLEFSVDGRRHRITRIPAGARDPDEPGRAASSKPARQVLTETAADGTEVVVLTRVAEIREHVEALLSMTSEQFRHLVVLPQGKFADLLRMTPTERLAELATLLDRGEFFARVQEDLKQQGARADERRRAARDDVQDAAQQLAGRLTGHARDVDFTDPALPDAERAGAVESVLDGIRTQLAEASARRDDLQAVARTREGEATAARAVATALADVRDAQQAVATAQAAIDAADDGLAADAVARRIGELRTREGSLADMATWEAQAASRQSERDRHVEHERTCTEQAEQLQAERATIPQKRDDLERQRAAALAAAGGLASARKEVERLVVLVEKADTHARTQAELAGLDATLGTREGEAATAQDQAARMHDAWLTLIDQQRAHQAAALAAALVPGAACPVCGSAEHPEPARIADDHVLVSDAEIDDARSRAEAARTLATEAVTAVTDARTAREDCAARLAVLAGALDGATTEELTAQREAAEAAEAEAAEAEAHLPGLQEAIDALATAEAELGDRSTALLTEAATTRGLITAHDERERSEQARIAAAIGDAPSATALLQHTRVRIAALEHLQEAQQRLAEVTATVPVDQRTRSAEDAQAAADAAEAAGREAQAALEQAVAVVTGLARTLDEATPLATAFTDAMARRREVDAGTAAAVQLAQLAAGRNPRSLPLRSFALQRRFESVLAAASVHLERMSSGKFAFELNEEVSRGQAGLGIALHDAWTGHRQDPKSLSGGETFYAALSLALGLADVVRGEAGGSALETLFIDEGFGSLDQDTLYQVLDQLDQLRSGRRVVGVISHVTEMKESIPDRIEVRRGDDSTSTIRRPASR